MDYYDLLIKDQNIIALEITPIHLEIATTLKPYRKDPFDRLLIGQAISEKFIVLTGDVQFEKYSVKCIWN